MLNQKLIPGCQLRPDFGGVLEIFQKFVTLEKSFPVGDQAIEIAFAVLRYVEVQKLAMKGGRARGQFNILGQNENSRQRAD